MWFKCKPCEHSNLRDTKISNLDRLTEYPINRMEIEGVCTSCRCLVRKERYLQKYDEILVEHLKEIIANLKETICKAKK